LAPTQDKLAFIRVCRGQLPEEFQGSISKMLEDWDLKTFSQVTILIIGTAKKWLSGLCWEENQELFKG
jgi:hypothetical protein